MDTIRITKISSWMECSTVDKTVPSQTEEAGGLDGWDFAIFSFPINAARFNLLYDFLVTMMIYFSKPY